MSTYSINADRKKNRKTSILKKMITSSSTNQLVQKNDLKSSYNPSFLNTERHLENAIVQKKTILKKNGNLKNQSISSSLTKNEIVQRYTIEDGSKVSKNKHMLINHDGDLYANTERIENADGISSNVNFVEGDQHDSYKALRKVKVEKTEGSEAFSESGDIDAEKVKSFIFDSIIKKLESEAEDAIYDSGLEEKEIDREIEALEGKLESVEEKNLDKILDLDVFGRIDRGKYETIIEGAKEYFLSLGSSGRELMRTDCRAFASLLSGFDAGSQGEITDQRVAGSVYQIDSSGSGDEWPFHYATIIMNDDTDHVTMENAAAKVSDGFSKPEFDDQWKFKMYGAEEGQSFDDEFSASLGGSSSEVKKKGSE